MATRKGSSHTPWKSATQQQARGIYGSAHAASPYPPSTSRCPLPCPLVTPPLRIGDRQRYTQIQSFFQRQASQAVSSRAARPIPIRAPINTLSRLPWSGTYGPSLLRAFTSSSTSYDAGDRRPPIPHEKPEIDKVRTDTTDQSKSQPEPDKPPSPSHHHDVSTAFANYPRTLRELALRTLSSASSSQRKDSLSDPPLLEAPRSSHPLRRPTKEDLLRSAHGFWTRLRIRFKWFTIRGFRRFNADDFSAFFTLGGLGTIALVVIGTTTAVSVVLWGLDMLHMQQWIARKIADYLSAQTGVTIVFESAIVPKWKESRICFQNVFITRRANANDPESLRLEREKRRKLRARQEREQRSRQTGRGTASTAGMGMAWEGVSHEEQQAADDEAVAPPLSSMATGEDLTQAERETVNTNFTMFDLNVDSIDVTLSISRWFDGKGLIEDAVVKGVRGIIDRRNVHWDPDKPYDPRAARRSSRPGDFEIESVEIQDLLVTIYQPSHFRPFNFSIFNASVPKLRKQWLFYDLLSAESITGQVDGCLFSLHKPQSIGRTTEKERELSKESGRWRTISRLRVDGVNIDHIQNQSGLQGPLSWIMSGRFDVVADIRFPRDAAEDVDINTIIAEIVDNLANAVGGGNQTSPEPLMDEEGRLQDTLPIPGRQKLNEPAIEAPLTTVGPAAERAWRQSVQATRLNNGEETNIDPLSEDNGERPSLRKSRLVRKLFKEKKGVQMEVTVADEELDEDFVKPGDDQVEGQGDTTSADQQDSSKPSQPTTTTLEELSTPPPPSVVIDLDVRFKDIKAAVPLFDSSLTYSRQAFVRPIVAFMNANKTLIPVHCRVVMDLSEFDGSMDLAQTGLLPLISEKLYEAMAHHVESGRANSQRLRNVSIWSLQQTLQAALRLAVTLRDSMQGQGSGTGKAVVVQ